MTKDDNRWESMCTDPLTGGKDVLLGADECVSPFGIYELEIPVNKDLTCGGSKITTFNCKDLDVSATSFSLIINLLAFWLIMLHWCKLAIEPWLMPLYLCCYKKYNRKIQLQYEL